MVISAGGIVTKIENGKLLLCLVKLTPPLEGYVFPKGHVKDGEGFEQAALRETEEETGLKSLEIIRKLGVVTRPSLENDGTQVMKSIHLYLMRTTNYKHGESDESYEWFTVDEAMSRLTFPQEAEFLTKNLSRLFSN